MMERLTIRHIRNSKVISTNNKGIAEVLNKLADYEDLEEQGLLLRLPVAIGNIVYRINEYAEEPIIPMGVTSIQINGITNTFKEIKCKECVFGGEFTYRFSEFGRTVFLTKAEAEQKLKEMENAKDVYWAGYNKAIDDFAEKLNAKCDGMIKDKWDSNVAPISWAEAYADFKDDIDDIAEQLKAGGRE